MRPPPTVWASLSLEDSSFNNPTAIQLFRICLAQHRYEINADWEELSVAERARAARYLVEPPRRRFLLCRRALRRCLAWMTGTSPSDIEFTVERFGKPRLALPEVCELDFNVTHSGDWGVIAVAYSRRVGVDLEVGDPQLDTQGLANRFFSQVEQEQLAQLPDDQRIAGFYRIWNTKEAYLKALGVGLSLPLGSFAAAANPAEPPGLVQGDIREGPWLGFAFQAAAAAPGVLLWNGGPAAVHTWDAPQSW